MQQLEMKLLRKLVLMECHWVRIRLLPISEKISQFREIKKTFRKKTSSFRKIKNIFPAMVFFACFFSSPSLTFY